MTKVIEAVRQLRGEAHPAVQVKNCDLALAHGTGGSLGTRHGSATVDHGAGVRAMADAASGPQDRAPADQSRDASRSGTRPREGKLLLKKCAACGEPHYYPRAHLPVLLQRQGRMARGLGHAATIYTYSVMRRAPDALLRSPT